MTSIIPVLGVVLLLCSLASGDSNARHLTQGGTAAVRIDEENASELVQLVSSLSRGDEIILAAGITVQLDSDLELITRRVTIRGEGQNENKPVIQCTSTSTRILITEPRIQLSNFVIRNCTGLVIEIGSSSANSSSDVDLEDLDFIGNFGAPSTALSLGSGSLLIGMGTSVTINNCNFESNTADYGGAIFIREPARVTISRSQFKGNRGGAIWTETSSSEEENNAFSSALIVLDSTFVRNEHRSPLEAEENEEVLDGRGARLESSTFIRFTAPLGAAGAIFASGVAQVEISRCSFRRNGARYLGAVTLSGNSNIRIINNTFIRNSPVSKDQERSYGGAIYYLQTDRNEGFITIEGSSFIGNRARVGGAIHAFGSSIASMEIIRCSFLRNQAGSYGGAITIRNFQVNMRATELIENTAHSGGAMAIVNGGGLRILAGRYLVRTRAAEDRLTEFRNNTATDGGALFISGTNSVDISEVRFIENVARRDGGAICIVHTLSGSSTDFRTCLFRSNRAQRGGAYFGSAASSVKFTSDVGGVGADHLERGRYSEDRNAPRRGFYGNTALAGGALYVTASNPFENRLDIRGERFEGNEALETFNETTSKRDNARNSYLDVLADDPCYPGGGGVACLVLNDISPRAQSQYAFMDSNFTANSASIGGALLISTAGIWNTSFPSRRSDSSGNSILLQNLMFQRNRARGAGGALFSTYPRDVLYTDEDDVENAYSLKDLALPNPSFEDNSVHRGGYGPHVASLADALELTSSESNLTNLESGVDSADIEIRLVDAFDQTVTDGVMDAAMHLSVDSQEGIASGGLESVVQKGYARFGVIITASPGEHQITIHGNRDQMELRLQVSTRGCFVGEHNIINLLCGLCAEGSFSLDINTDCQTCPTHGNCSGGAVMVPVEGYWHSTPFSPVMHDCLEFDACAYRGRQKILTEFYSKEASGGNLTVIAEPFEEEYPQCRRGYRGVLCGSCTADYGHVANGKCKSCNNESRTRFLVIFSGVWMLILMTFTIRSALISIRDFIAVKSHALHSANLAQNPMAPTSPNIGCTVAGQVLQLPQRNGSITSNSGSDSLSSSPTFRRQGMQVTGATNGNNAILNSPPGPGILNSPAPQAANLPPTAPIDHILAAEKIAETIKIFTNFLQITSVGVVINIEWTEVIKQMLTINDGVAGFSNGSSIAPMECIVGGSQGERSIRHAILRIFMPVMLMLITMCFFALHWLRLKTKHNKPVSYLRSRIIICALVASFFSYHKITEHLMRILNCMYLDHGKDLSHERCPSCRFYEDYAIARDYYWAEDTSHKCFEGKHAKLAYFLGFPGLFLFSLGVPLAILWTLVYNKVHDRLHDIQVLNSFGFVYQNYKDRFMFWEVLIMCRKAAVGAIVVFAYSLGGNLQSVMILGTLLIALLSQISAFPFNDYTLNILETSSLLVSILTFYFAIVFNDPNTSDYAKRAFSVILLLLTVFLVVAFFAVLVFNMDAFVEAKLKQMGHSVPHGRLQRPFKLAKVVTTRVYVSLEEKYNRHMTVIRENRRRRREARKQRKAAQRSVGRTVNGSQPLPSPPSTPGQDSGSYHTSVEINPSI